MSFCFNTVPLEILQIWVESELLIAEFLMGFLLLLINLSIFHMPACDVEVVLWIATHCL